ncbi:MAG: polymerase, sigma 28 subunit, SigD/FliA/WhiG [Deferribacteraceae bacterium]|nr:polymerase, sigma 28 subunit, SigD/FliA/WhiG [Deferribacteraceae bacterium]
MTGYDKYLDKISAEDQNALAEEFIPKIKSWVIRISHTLPSSVDIDELYSAACLGLVESFKRFDKSRNVEFKAFAERRIKGAILDALRQMDVLPRNLRTKVKSLETKIAELSTKLGRKPNAEELAEYTNLELDEVFYLLQVLENNQVISLNNSVGDDNETDLVDFIKGTFLNPEEALEKEELIGLLSDAIDKLNEKEKAVITLYYYEELTMKEIGEVLNITESRTSQIHSAAVAKLKKRLKGAFYGN